jgi:hypothetical protein
MGIGAYDGGPFQWTTIDIRFRSGLPPLGTGLPYHALTVRSALAGLERREAFKHLGLFKMQMHFERALRYSVFLAVLKNCEKPQCTFKTNEF